MGYHVRIDQLKSNEKEIEQAKRKYVCILLEIEGITSRWQWGPETRVPAGFYPIRGRGWASFHSRGAVVRRIIQPGMFHGFTPISIVSEPET